MIRADGVFREGAVLDLALKKANDELLWVYGTVQRICTVQHAQRLHYSRAPV